MTATDRLAAVVGPNLAGAILDALREEIAAAPTSHAEPATRWLPSSRPPGTSARRRRQFAAASTVDGSKSCETDAASMSTATRSTPHSPPKGVCSM